VNPFSKKVYISQLNRGLEMFELKVYQKNTLDTLRSYLEQVRYSGAENAYHQIKELSVYNKIKGLEDVPYVCLRLPTGGGKTYLASNTIPLVAKTYLETETPMVLWFCPTTTIKTQTIETLKNPRHPNREVLEKAFGGNILVFDIEDYANVRAQDIESKCCIFVSTFQTFKITDTNARRIYAHNENLEPHFSKIANLQCKEDLELIETGEDKGKVKYSFANLLNIHRPIVIADEAHNNSTKLAYEMLKRVNPSCIVEYTATPATNSNVLHHVCAMELKAEDMIKLPIILTVHQTWQQSLSASIIARKGLSELAKKDSSYIRPILLIQAESKDKEVTVDVIKKYLIEQENIEEEHIAIATGDQRELDGINIFDSKCPIEYVITVEALKEGWDCSFAYVFCSVANRHSTKDIEQLLGRVLRMPYAKTRDQEELNKAYAFVSNTTWQEGVAQLKDRLVEMGFEENEILNTIQGKLPVLLGGDEGKKPITLNVSDFDMKEFTQEEQQQIEVKETPVGKVVSIKEDTKVTPELEEKIIQATPERERKSVEISLKVELRNRIVYERKTPSQEGKPFKIPQLQLFIDGDWVCDYDEFFLDPSGKWLLDYPAKLTEGEFRIRSTGASISIDIKGNHIEDRYIQETIALDFGDSNTDWTVPKLSIWLTQQISNPSISQPVQLQFIRQLVENLCIDRKISLNDLVRTKFILKDSIRDKINEYKHKAEQEGMQKTLFASDTKVQTNFNYNIDFTGKYYMPTTAYMGTAFNKHYFAQVGDMNKEEVECARLIDSLPNVKYWIRNIEKHLYSFYIPMATSNFYPDFVALLNDDRILVVEYKGEHLVTNDDSKNKDTIGQLWAKSSKGKCLFLMAKKKDENGYTLAEQLNNIVK
jgi:type III restriction enzyme